MHLQSIGWKIYHAGMSFNSIYFLAYSISKIMLKVKKNGNPASKKKRRFISLTYTLIKFNLTALNTFAFKFRLYKKIYATDKKMETLLAVQRCPFCLT